MNKIKKIILWVLVAAIGLIGLVAIPSISSIIAALVILLIIPIDRWQSLIRKYIKGTYKAIIAVVLSVSMLYSFPGSDTTADTDTTDNTTSLSTIETIASGTEFSDPIAEPETTSATESVVIPTPDSTQPDIDEINDPTNPPTEDVSTPSASESTEPTVEPTESTEPVEPTEPPHTHTFSAATCTEPKTCSCGETQGDANGHEWRDATYTTPQTCSVCGATEGSSLAIPGKENYHGHVYTGGSNSTKFHYEENCAGKYSHEITWEEVEDDNLGPCGTCVLK